MSQHEDTRALDLLVHTAIPSIRDYAIVLLDPQGMIRTWNEGARRVKGYEASEIIGRSFTQFYTEQDRAAGRPHSLLRRAMLDGRSEDEGWRVRKDGGRFWANVVISAVRDPEGTLLGYAKVTRDMSERRRLERELWEEQKRGELAQLAIKAREEFILVAAHELRTPLTALLLKLESLESTLLKSQPPPADGARLAERATAAVRQAQRLGSLVERVLDVSRIVAGNVDLRRERTDLGELVHAVSDDLRHSALEQGSLLQLHVTPQVCGSWDRTRLQQVVINLVSNAVKYGEGRPIEIWVERDEACARLRVADHGIGISAEALTRIFERFERAAPINNYGGLGLGLYVARRIVEAHGGTIAAQSEGKGSTFTVELPLEASATPA